MYPRHIPDSEDSADDNVSCGDHVRLTATIKASSYVGMQPLCTARRQLVAPCEILHHDLWDAILCAGVPVSLRELVSLSLKQLQLRDNQDNRHKILQCSWELGWHVTSTLSGVNYHYWGGGITPDTTDSFRRGDWIEVAGTELCQHVETSRLARVICGFKIRNVKRVFENVDNTDWENVDCRKNDYVVYLLIRYAMAHPDCGRERGPEHRPLCPGELRNTHCLWKWYERRANFRRGCWRARPWDRHKHLFGDTLDQQERRKAQECRAWYDVIQSSNIVGHANVTSDWDRDDSFLQSVIWA